MPVDEFISPLVHVSSLYFKVLLFVAYIFRILMDLSFLYKLNIIHLFISSIPFCSKI